MKYENNWESLNSRPVPEWFADAKFGIFIHWGLYANYAQGEWYLQNFPIDKYEYAKAADAFYPHRFDAKKWVETIKASGAKYICFTSRHHDSFSMWDTEQSDFNIVDATPFGRDVVAEFGEACYKYGLKFGLYYSQELDWHEPNSGGFLLDKPQNYTGWANTWDYPDNSKKQFEQYFYAKAILQVKEILTKYGDLCLMWFDVPHTITPAQSLELNNLVIKIYNL